MKIKTLGKNQTLLIKDSGNEVFFSYNTPVAGKWMDGYIRTNKTYSATTTKHINAYLEGKDAKPVNPDFFDIL